MKNRAAQLTGLLAALLLTLCGWNAMAAPKLTLTKNGEATATIVLARDANRAARFAAYELREHVYRISGASLPVVTEKEAALGVPIYVGASLATAAMGLTNDSFAHQEYLIRFLPDALVLMGRDKVDPGEPKMDYTANANASQSWPDVWDEQGTMYAVYDFLRDYCGVRWFNPTDVGTVCPKQPTLKVTGKEVRRKPFMWYRGGTMISQPQRVQWGGGMWREGTAEGGKYMEIGYPAVYAAFDNANARNIAIRSQNTLFMLRHKGGGKKAPCNHSFYNFYERFYNKDSANFESYHPEYFAQGYEGQPPQMCYSNDGFVEQVLKDIRAYFDEGGYQKRFSGIGAPGYHWGEDFFALEPMDNAAFCKCPACAPQREADRPRAEQDSTYWFRFVNRIAREIKKTHPDKKITTLAYMTHEGLPTDLQVEDNVIVYFCISGNRMPYSPLLGRQMALVQKWYDNQHVPMSLWLYNTFPNEIANNGKFYAFPGFFAHAYGDQFKAFKRWQINGIFHCGFHGEVENYLSWRLMDDPDADVDDMLDDYFAMFYGPAGPAIRKFYTLVETRYCDPASYPKQGDQPYGGHQNVRLAWKYLGNAETMAKLADYVAEAYAAVRTPEQTTRVALWDQGVYQYMKTGHDTYNRRMAAPIPEVVAKRVPTAGGDPDKVAWDQAGFLTDKLYDRGSDNPVPFKIDGRVAHDGEYLYMELVDHCDTSKINVSPQIACYDDWEIMFARQRAQPFRQYLVGPTAMTQALSYGEVNWRQGVPAAEHAEHAFGLKAKSNTKGDAWVLRLAFPLSMVTDQPIKPGDSIYSNLIRVRGPELNKDVGSGIGIESWVSYMTVKEVDRAGVIKLEE